MIAIGKIVAAMTELERQQAILALQTLKSVGFFALAVKLTKESVIENWSRDADQFDLLHRINETNHETQLYGALEEASKLTP